MATVNQTISTLTRRIARSPSLAARAKFMSLSPSRSALPGRSSGYRRRAVTVRRSWSPRATSTTARQACSTPKSARQCVSGSRSGIAQHIGATVEDQRRPHHLPPTRRATPRFHLHACPRRAVHRYRHSGRCGRTTASYRRPSRAINHAKAAGRAPSSWPSTKMDSPTLGANASASSRS